MLPEIAVHNAANNASSGEPTAELQEGSLTPHSSPQQRSSVGAYLFSKKGSFRISSHQGAGPCSHFYVGAGGERPGSSGVQCRTEGTLTFIGEMNSTQSL